MSKAYYNEIDPFAAEWLRKLIRHGHIAPGEVDERSIEDVSPADLAGFTQCHFFAGVGAWSYALRLAGWPDDRPVWTGSCPCQPFSAAGKGAGFADERHLWPSFYWLISQCRPLVAFGEQVAGKSGRAWFDVVAADMEAGNYRCGKVIFPACGVGEVHKRERLYWAADSQRTGWKRFKYNNSVSGSEKAPHAERGDVPSISRCALEGHFSILRRHDGTTVGMERRIIHGFGNAINVKQAKEFIKAYLETRYAAV